MWLKWFPWRFMVSRLARAYGFSDPVVWLNRMRRFAHPSEVTEPLELLRAGVLFHARGLINTRAIQHNLDWIWPYWVQRQFNPSDPSFVPRGFSFTHINLTHRNWTAVGLPDLPIYPIVDPRGLVTPLYDGWSLDFWLIGTDGRWLCRRNSNTRNNVLETDDRLRVISVSPKGWHLTTDVSLEIHEGQSLCVVRATATAPEEIRLAVVAASLQP